MANVAVAESIQYINGNLISWLLCPILNNSIDKYSCVVDLALLFVWMTYPTPSPSFFKTDLKAGQTQFPALTMYLLPTSLFKILLMPLLQFFLSARIAASVLSFCLSLLPCFVLHMFIVCWYWWCQSWCTATLPSYDFWNYCWFCYFCAI